MRSAGINRTRGSPGRFVRTFTILGLVLLALGGGVMILMSMDFGYWFAPQGSGKLEEGGRLIIRERPSQKLPRGPDKETPKDLPRKEELTFYQALTDKADKNSSRLDLQPRNVAPSSKSKSIKTQLNKKGGQDSGSADKAMRQSASGGMPEHTPPHLIEKRYTLQVGSFTEKASAQRLAQKLVGRGYPAYVIKTLLADRDVRYRVRVGHFADKIQAKAIAGRLEEQEGLKAFIAYLNEGAQ